MKIFQFPGKLSCYELVGGGAVGYVFRINDRIVFKSARDADSEAFANENALYDLFEKQATSCPSIVRSFLRLPNGNFLACMGGGSLQARLQSNQVRTNRTKPGQGRVLDVLAKEPEERVAQWLRELTGAVVWLADTLGLVHGDLRPNNLLLDNNQEHLKLADFDCAEKLGDWSSGNAPPWARVLGDDVDTVAKSEPGVGRGSFGRYSARTEQFAIGSIVYCMFYGMEPYEDSEELERDPTLLVKWMRDRKFPPLQQDRSLDNIIAKCWNNAYGQLQDLLDEAEALSPSDVVDLSREEIDKRRDECQALLDEGLLQRA